MNVHIYTPEELPQPYKTQILSFLSQQWPEGFTGKNQDRNWIDPKAFHPVHAVATESDTVISHAGIVWKLLSHAGKEYKTYGLSAVFVHPSHRKKGCGAQIVQEAKKYIERQDGDIALFTSCIIGFYEKAGFLPLPTAKLLQGNPKNPMENSEQVFMLFLSEKGKAGKADFETQPIYFGEEMW